MNFVANVHYQDFSLNVGQMIGQPIIIRRSEAVMVGILDIKAENVLDACEQVFEKMNNLNIPVGHSARPVFEKAGHTSMSVGDYIEFEGHAGIYFCASRGFVNLTEKEIAESEAVKEK